jgi:uncharacterized delta-60 repeat protein
MNRTIRQRRPARQCPRVEPLESRSLLSLAGTLDTSFNNVNDLVVPSGYGATSYPSSLALSALAPDGSIVVADSFVEGDLDNGPSFFTIAKFNADGSPDTSFGQDGRATFQVGSGVGDATSLVIRPDGTIDLGGTLNASSVSTTATASVGVIQLTPSGALDTTFGDQGIATLPALDPADQEPFHDLGAMTLTSSGQLIVAGSDVNASSSTTTSAFYVARLNTDGTLDTTFGTGGVAADPVTINGYTTDEATAVALQPDGQIVVGGYATYDIIPVGIDMDTLDNSVAIRLDSNGTVDTSFGGTSANGEVILSPVPSDPTSPGIRKVVGMAVQSNGQIVLAETDSLYQSIGGFFSAYPTGDMTRLNADGTLDTTFGDGGTATFTNGLVPYGLTVESSGQILVPGEGPDTNDVDHDGPALGRFNSDGTPDASFGSPENPGLAVYGSYDPYINSSNGPFTTALVDSAGGIVLAGSDSTSSGGTEGVSFEYFEVERALSTPTITRVETEPPADFDGSGKTNISVYLPASGEFAYRPTNGGPDVLVPFGIPGLGQTIPAPGDYTGLGQTEIAAYLPSQGIYAYRPADGGPDVLQSFGIAGPGQSIPVPGDYFGTGVDDIAVYMPSIGAFGIRNPNGGPDEIIPFGIAGMGNSIPAPGDYFGTGQTDLAVYLPSIGAFGIRNPAGGPDEIIPFGIPGAGNSIPIPGDYDDSGKTELAVYLPKLGEFAYRPANGGPDVIGFFGTANDGSIPVPGDYLGLGFDQIGIYDPNYGDFAYRPPGFDFGLSGGGDPDVIVPFGSPGIGASLPLAAPISSNVALANPGTLSALSVASSPTVSSEAVAVIKQTTAVPGGPMAKVAAKALVRISSILPAQADPSKPKT